MQRDEWPGKQSLGFLTYASSNVGDIDLRSDDHKEYTSTEHNLEINLVLKK